MELEKKSPKKKRKV